LSIKTEKNAKDIQENDKMLVRVKVQTKTYQLGECEVLELQ